MLQKDNEGYDIEIRDMNIADVKQVAEIEKECFSAPWSEKAFEIELEKEGAITLVAVCNGEVTGFINAQLVLDEVYINNVAVTEKFRKSGIGKNLLTKLEEKVLRTASLITLEVRCSNVPAIKLYGKCEYENVGIRKNFYEMPTEDAILMTKIIRNV